MDKCPLVHGRYMSFRRTKGDKLVGIDDDQYTNQAGVGMNDEERPSARFSRALPHGRAFHVCAEHVRQLEGASPFDNLMEVKS